MSYILVVDLLLVVVVRLVLSHVVEGEIALLAIQLSIPPVLIRLLQDCMTGLKMMNETTVQSVDQSRSHL